MRALYRLQCLSARALLACLALFLGLARASAESPYGKPGNLNVVSVGIAAIPRPKLNPIPSCKKDAEDIVHWARSQKGKLFANVHANLLLEQRATSGNILAALKQLEARAKQGDYSIVYLSSHGGCGADGEFGFAAYDRDLRSSEIQRALRHVPGTVILIIDACHCGGVKGDNLIVLSASLKDQNSCGYGSDKMNSLFTRFLLEALQGAADTNGDGMITLSEVETYVSNKLVQENRNRKASEHQTMTVTRPGNVPSALPLAKLASAAARQPAPAQKQGAQRPAPAIKNLTGTTWTGSEDLATGYGKLSFRLLDNGKAVMIDAKDTVPGKLRLCRGDQRGHDQRQRPR